MWLWSLCPCMTIVTHPPVQADWFLWSREERYHRPEALDLYFQIAPSGLRQEELFHHAARPLITRISRLKVLWRRLAVHRYPSSSGRTVMSTALEGTVTIGVGIDTA